MLRRRAARPPTLATAPRPTARPMLFAAVAGAASVLSFAPLGWWPVQMLTLAFLFYQVGMDTNTRRSTLLGWAFGFGWSVAGMHWLYIAMHRFGDLPGVLAALAVCLLGLYLGVFGALATGVATWLRRRWSLPVPAFLLLVLPVTWAVSEWLRGWIFTGFPWVVSGYAHTDSPLAGFAPLVGVYGIGMVVALCASCLVMLTQRARAPAMGLFAVLLAAGFGLTYIDWTHASGKPISVRLLQGNVPQNEKFDAGHLVRTLEQYRALITAERADLVATPETAVPLFPQQLPGDYLPALAAFARDSNSTLIYGIPLADSETRYTNSAVGVTPQGQAYRYDKQHLVPFGEFVPTGFRWFVDMMHIPLGDFTSGAVVQAPLAVKDQLVLPNVCYEDLFGEEIALNLRSAAHPATLLLNISNLAWYGESVAIPQHLQISRMRSLETGRPMLRATNSGATAVIDAHGKVAAALPFYQPGTLSANVQGMAGSTPYILGGNYLFLALGALGLGSAFALGRNFRQKGANPGQK
jgi:apolipoprotein N-acyltransferase